MYKVKATASFDHHGSRRLNEVFTVGSKRQADELARKGLVEILGENSGNTDSAKRGTEPSDPPAFSPELLERNAPELVAWAADIGDRDQLQAALAGEREGKKRKGVIEALEKALAD